LRARKSIVACSRWRVSLVQVEWGWTWTTDQRKDRKCFYCHCSKISTHDDRAVDTTALKYLLCI
jgi:hypothetical protein